LALSLGCLFFAAVAGIRWRASSVPDLAEAGYDGQPQFPSRGSEKIEVRDVNDLIAIRRLERLENAFLREQGGIEAFLAERDQLAVWLVKGLEEARQTPGSVATSPHGELGCFFLDGDAIKRHCLAKEVDTFLDIRALVRRIEANPMTPEAGQAWQQLAQRLSVFWGGNSGTPPPRQTREVLRVYRTLAYGT